MDTLLWFTIGILGSGLFAQPAFAQAPTDAPAPEVIGILTPGIPKSLQIDRTIDSAAQLTLGLSAAMGMNKAEALTEQANRDGFDAGARLMDHLMTAFAARSLPATRIDISRPASVDPQPLTRDRIPDDAASGAGRLLDVSVTGLGLDVRGPMVETFAKASYRVVGVRGGLLQSSRIVNVNAVDHVGTVTPSWKPPAPPREALPVARECRFQFRFDQDKDSVRLWQCLDQALADIATRIAEDPIWSAPSPKSTSLD